MLELVIPKFLDQLYDSSVSKLLTLDEIRDAFHTNQIESKKQAVEAFATVRGSNVLYVGSWIGFLTYYLSREYPSIKFSNLDLDYRYSVFSKKFSQVPHYTADIIHFNKLNEFDTIINLSCEHMSNEWFNLIAPGTNVVLQSNNFNVINEHVNCCADLQDMQNKFNLTEITFANTLELNVYNRFTLAGIK